LYICKHNLQAAIDKENGGLMDVNRQLYNHVYSLR